MLSGFAKLRLIAAYGLRLAAGGEIEFLLPEPLPNSVIAF
jgi:hypothetical protein